MIRYDITADDLHALVEEYVPGWLARAEDRTATFMKRRRYAERRSIWNEVKPVFMKVQGDGKCGFCERKFESGDLGRHELDIEHFRPKSRIAEWRYPRFLMDAGYSQTLPPDTETGYYLLSQPGIAGTKRRLTEKSSSFCRRLHGQETTARVSTGSRSRESVLS